MSLSGTMYETNLSHFATLCGVVARREVVVRSAVYVRMVKVVRVSVKVEASSGRRTSS